MAEPAFASRARRPSSMGPTLSSDSFRRLRASWVINCLVVSLAMMSTFALLAPDTVQGGLDRLAADLRSGRWDERFGDLRLMESIDLGYRLLIAQHRGRE